MVMMMMNDGVDDGGDDSGDDGVDDGADLPSDYRFEDSGTSALESHTS